MSRVAPLLLLVAVLAVAAGCSGTEAQEAERPAASPTNAAATATTPAPATTEREAEDRPAAVGGGEGAIPDIVERVAPSVVTVLVQRANGQAGGGSGVIWDAEGTIVTNEHVIRGAVQVRVVLASGEELDAEVRAFDDLTDLAVLRVERTDLPPAEFAAELPRVGELAIAMGSPLGLEGTVTSGIVSGLHREVPAGGQTAALIDLLQTDAPISPGNSGGALVNGRGEVIGINVAYLPPQAVGAVSIGFAIPSPTVVRVVEQLVETGQVEHAFLGIQPAPVTEELAAQFGLGADEGVLVLEAQPGMPAAEAGMRRGDVIVELAGEQIRTVEDLFGALRTVSPGDRVPAVVARGDERVELTVVPVARPASE